MSTDGCPPDAPPKLPPQSRDRSVTTLHKQGHAPILPLLRSPDSSVTTPNEEGPSYKLKPNPDNVTSSASPAPPLISTCDVMPQVVASLNSAPGGILSCVHSPSPDCTHIRCNISDTQDVLQASFLPCADVPALRLVVTDGGNATLTNLTVSASRSVSLNITNSSVPLHFTIASHSDYLSMGIMVSQNVYL